VFVFERVHEFGGSGFGPDPQLVQYFGNGHFCATVQFETKMCLNPCFKT
jgi:hypothetical protein